MEYKKVRKMYLKCEDCGKENEKVREYEKFDYMILCRACHNRRLRCPQNSIPPKGEVHYDENGNVICHICGKSFSRLGHHITRFHKMSVEEYKEKYELDPKTKLVNIKNKDKDNDSEQLKMY